MNKIVSACGLDCNACDCFIASQTGDLEMKKTVARKWSKDYEAVLTADDIHCDGCMSPGTHFSWCYKCPIRTCVIKKRYHSCAECDVFPCDKTESLYQAVPQAKSVIESMRTR